MIIHSNGRLIRLPGHKSRVNKPSCSTTLPLSKSYHIISNAGMLLRSGLDLELSSLPSISTTTSTSSASSNFRMLLLDEESRSGFPVVPRPSNQVQDHESPGESGRKARLSQSINLLIDALPSAHQRSRAQTAAYLLGARQELPDVDENEINRIRAVRLVYDAMADQPTSTHSLGLTTGEAFAQSESYKQDPDLQERLEKGKLN